MQKVILISTFNIIGIGLGGTGMSKFLIGTSNMPLTLTGVGLMHFSLYLPVPLIYNILFFLKSKLGFKLAILQ